jgi:hypothetical protein
VFALVRSKTNSQKLTELGAANVHIFEADITDVKALKVRYMSIITRLGSDPYSFRLLHQK